MLDATGTIVKSHNFYHYIRKWQLHVWNFAALGNTYVLKLGGYQKWSFSSLDWGVQIEHAWR